MAGLLGVVRPRAAASASYGRAAAEAAPHVIRRTETYRDPANHWIVELATMGVLEAPPNQSPDAKTIVLFRGDLFNESALRSSAALPPGSQADLIVALYERHGDGFVDRLDGSFGLAILDSTRRRVLIASDPFGSYPIYWHAAPSGFTFGSEVRTLLRAIEEPATLDVRAVADYVTLGTVLGEKTLAGGVSLLDPGTSLAYDWTSGAVTRTRYFEVATLFQGPAPSRSEYVDAVRAAFAGSVSKTLSGSHTFGLSLSGGLDSRAVLSAINGSAPRLVTYTLGVNGCADQVIASRLSQIAGTDHRFFELDDSYLRDFLTHQERMVSITDGLYLSHGLTEMLALGFLGRTGIDVLLRGHGGELAKTDLAWPLHTDEHVFTLNTTAELVSYLAGRANYVTRELTPAALFTPDVADRAGRGAIDTLAAVAQPLTLTPPQLCSYFYLRELHRRFTIPSIELFRTTLEVRMPFVDRGFLGVLFSGDPAWRTDTSLHRAMTRAGSPALLRVRNSNTGARGDAGPLTEKVLDKFNTLFKRMNVYGYRHYHSFDAWMRTRLLETVEQKLLAADARTRAFLRPDVLRRLIDETRQGTADRGYLLQVLLTIELWQRQNGVERVAA